jgi:predicted outer membrane protein
MVNKLLVAGLMCASLALAQRSGRGGGGDTSATPQMMSVQTKFDTIAATLALSKDQKKAVKTILDEGAKEAAPVRDQISKSRIAVGEAILAKKSDDEIKQAAAGSSGFSAQLSEIELQTFAKIYASLDDTQKANRPGLSRVLGLMMGIYRNKNWNEE